MKLLDLSYTISNSTPTFPGDPFPKLSKRSDVARDGFCDFEISIPSHIGTHLDGPMHMGIENFFISDVSIEKIFGDGILVDIRGKKKVTPLDLPEKILPGSVLLFWSGLRITDPDFFSESPELSVELATLLVSKKIKMIGLDFSSPDSEPFPIHKIFLEAGILILENLMDLSQLKQYEKFSVLALPLKIETDSAPCRVVALID